MKWIYNDGTSMEISKMSAEELIAAREILASRQVHAIDKLKKSEEISKVIEKECKDRGIDLDAELSASSYTGTVRYLKLKPVITTVTGSIKRKERSLRNG